MGKIQKGQHLLGGGKILPIVEKEHPFFKKRSWVLGLFPKLEGQLFFGWLGVAKISQFSVGGPLKPGF